MTLNWPIWRVGTILRGRGPWRVLRAAAMMLGAITLGGGLIATAIWAHASDVRDSAVADRLRPIDAMRASASALYSYDGFISLNDRQVLIISIWPLRSSATPPPGVDAWPNPGEAVLSPAVVQSLKGHPADLFGTPAGIIRPPGLETPTDRRVYLRPSVNSFDPASMTPIAGFGYRGDDSFLGLPSLNRVADHLVLALLAATLLIPGIVILILSSRLDGETRARRQRQLVMVGASRGQLALIDLADTWRPVAAGALVVVIGSGYLTWHGFGLSWLDARYDAKTIRSGWQDLCLAVGGTYLLSLATILSARRVRNYDATNSSLIPDATLPLRGALAFVLSFLVTIWLPAIVPPGSIRVLSFVIGSMIAGVTLSSFVAVVLAAIGKSLAQVGMRKGSVAALLGGRRLQLFPNRTRRVLLGLCLAVIVVGQIQLWSSALNVQYVDALQSRHELGNRVLQAGHIAYGGQLEEFLTDQERQVTPIWTWYEQHRTHAEVVLAGSCPALRAVGLACSATDSVNEHTRMLSAVAGGGSIPIKSMGTSIPTMSDLQSLGANLYLVSPQGDDLQIDELQRSAYQRVPGGMQLESVSEGFITAGRLTTTLGNWTVLFGSVGVIVLLLGLGFVLAGDAISGGRELGSVAALTERRRWLFALCAIRIGLPVVLGGSLSSLAYWLLPTGMETADYLHPSAAVALAVVVASVVAGVALSAWSGYQLASSSRGWHPGRGAV